MSKSKPIPEGVEITDAITKHMDRRFLSSLDLIGQGEVALTISKVTKHEVLEYANGNKDEGAILLHFKETPKPLKLCNTNIKAIIANMGSNKPEEWKGRKITLKVEKVQAFGAMKDAVRVQ